MKQKEEYLKDRVSYVKDLEKIVTKDVISKNKDFFNHCYDWKITPERAVNFLIN